VFLSSLTFLFPCKCLFSFARKIHCHVGKKTSTYFSFLWGFVFFFIFSFWFLEKANGQNPIYSFRNFNIQNGIPCKNPLFDFPGLGSLSFHPFYGFGSGLRRIANSTNKEPGVGHEVFVLKVIDGDTVELSNGEKVRYVGIDAPEIKKKIKGKWREAPQPFGLPAFRFNRHLVEGHTVYLEFDQKERDNYERLLGYLYVDGVMVNALLVQEGYARVSLHPPNLKYASRLLGLQRKAWEERRGIWAAHVQVDQGH